MRQYNLTKTNPVLRFWYQGASHSHPVRRTVLKIRETPKYITGYEVRVGRDTASVTNAPIKTYLKDKIIRYGDFCRTREAKRNQGLAEVTTLRRGPIEDFLFNGA